MTAPSPVHPWRTRGKDGWEDRCTRYERLPIWMDLDQTVDNAPPDGLLLEHAKQTTLTAARTEPNLTEELCWLDALDCAIERECIRKRKDADWVRMVANLAADRQSQARRQMLRDRLTVVRDIPEDPRVAWIPEQIKRSFGIPYKPGGVQDLLAWQEARAAAGLARGY